MDTNRMRSEVWFKIWIPLSFMVIGAKCARPRFDISTDMGLVLVPADAEVDSVIFRLRATDQDVDFPLVFEITSTISPIVRIENLPCTLYNKVCQANVILTKRLTAGRLHDFAVRVRDSKGDSNSMQATISVTNATTPRDTIFPHIPTLIMVPEDTKPGKELDYILVKSNPWGGKPVYIELWQPKELFTIKQKLIAGHTRGTIILTGELDFETQSMYTVTIYATDPYTEPKKDTRNIAGLHLIVVVQDVQDVPPIFTLAPPLTKINNTVQPGDVILRVHAEDGDKGVPREITYGLVSEGNPFTLFFNITESTGEIILARPLEELTQITHVGAPIVLSVVAEEIRRSTDEPPAQATVVKVGLLLGEPGNSPPYFENDNYVAWMDENALPGTAIMFEEPYSTRVRDEDIGKAGVFTLKLENNNGTFEISPSVAERTANFILTVRDNALIDYEVYKSLRFKIVAQEVGPTTNLSASVPVTIFLKDKNDNPPEFQDASYEVTLSENVTAGTRVTQVHATDKDTGFFGRIQYTQIIGLGNEALTIHPDSGVITVSMATQYLDREITPQLQLTVEARDEEGKGLRGTVPLFVNLLDANDNAPIFEKDVYEFTLNVDGTNFTIPAIIRALDADAEPPNNEVHYEIIHGNYENKFFLDETSGELFLREPITKIRNTRHNSYQRFATKQRRVLASTSETPENFSQNILNDSQKLIDKSILYDLLNNSTEVNLYDNNDTNVTTEENRVNVVKRSKREDKEVLFALTIRAYDLGVPHLSGTTQVKIFQSPQAGVRTLMFLVPGEHPDRNKTAQTLATITGGKVTVLEIRPYTPGSLPNGTDDLPSSGSGKKSIVIAKVEYAGTGWSVVDIEKIRAALAANGVGVIGGDMMPNDGKPTVGTNNTTDNKNTSTPSGNGGTVINKNVSVVNTNDETTINKNASITTVISEEVTVYKAENQLLMWLLIILGLLMLAAIIILIVCCICPGCPFYMAPRKRRVHSSETFVTRTDGRPKKHIYRKHPIAEGPYSDKKQAWSADQTRDNWQFNRRNTRNYGIASLPGDVIYDDGVRDRDEEFPRKAHSLRLQETTTIPIHILTTRKDGRHSHLYIEDTNLRAKGYDMTDMESMRQNEMEHGSTMTRQAFMHEAPEKDQDSIRDQHFYRAGNAEVMRLVTRDAPAANISYRQPEIVIDQIQRIDGKDILLRRFIEDQNLRIEHDYHGSMQDLEKQSMESHKRQREVSLKQQQQHQQQQQEEIILIPEQLETSPRQHIEELGPDIQRLIIDHGAYEKTIQSEMKETHDVAAGTTLLIPETVPKASDAPKEDKMEKCQHYSVHDLELARQNALLTRLLLERDRGVSGIMMDTGSYLETQSLPGQVAAGTQTNQSIATQTEQQSRSRSDNEESEEDARLRRRMRSKKRYDGETKRVRTLWMRSPIREEDREYYEKNLTFTRRKIKEMKEARKSSIEPEVLREISDSLDDRETPGLNRESFGDSSNSRYESREEVTQRDDSSSMDNVRDKYAKRKVDDRNETRKKEKEVTGTEELQEVKKPSFKILEREMSSLSKKLSKLTGKKIPREEGGHKKDKLTSDSRDKDVNSDIELDKKIKKIDGSRAKRLKLIQRGVGLSPLETKVPERKRDKLGKIQQKEKKQSTCSELEEFEKSKKQSVTKQAGIAGSETAVGKIVKAKLTRQLAVKERPPHVSKQKDELKRMGKEDKKKMERKGEIISIVDIRSIDSLKESAELLQKLIDNSLKSKEFKKRSKEILFSTDESQGTRDSGESDQKFSSDKISTPTPTKGILRSSETGTDQMSHSESRDDDDYQRKKMSSEVTAVENKIIKDVRSINDLSEVVEIIQEKTDMRNKLEKSTKEDEIKEEMMKIKKEAEELKEIATTKEESLPLRVSKIPEEEIEEKMEKTVEFTSTMEEVDGEEISKQIEEDSNSLKTDAVGEDETVDKTEKIDEMLKKQDDIKEIVSEEIMQMTKDEDKKIFCKETETELPEKSQIKSDVEIISPMKTQVKCEVLEKIQVIQEVAKEIQKISGIQEVKEEIQKIPEIQEVEEEIQKIPEIQEEMKIKLESPIISPDKVQSKPGTPYKEDIKITEVAIGSSVELLKPFDEEIKIHEDIISTLEETTKTEDKSEKNFTKKLEEEEEGATTRKKIEDDKISEDENLKTTEKITEYSEDVYKKSPSAIEEMKKEILTSPEKKVKEDEDKFTEEKSELLILATVDSEKNEEKLEDVDKEKIEICSKKETLDDSSVPVNENEEKYLTSTVEDSKEKSPTPTVEEEKIKMQPTKEEILVNILEVPGSRTIVKENVDKIPEAEKILQTTSKTDDSLKSSEEHFEQDKEVKTAEAKMPTEDDAKKTTSDLKSPTKIEDSLLEPVSPAKSQTSSLSPKQVVISRETSFLSSPRRLPTEESLDTKSPKDEQKKESESESESQLEVHISEDKDDSSVTKKIEIFVDKPEIPVKSPTQDVLPGPISPLLKHTEDDSLEDLIDDTYDDDSDESSESSTQTAFIARPYGTPRHRRLVRMEHVPADELESDATSDQSKLKHSPVSSDAFTESDDEKIQSPEKSDSSDVMKNGEAISKREERSSDDSTSIQDVKRISDKSEEDSGVKDETKQETIVEEMTKKSDSHDQKEVEHVHEDVEQQQKLLTESQQKCHEKLDPKSASDDDKIEQTDQVQLIDKSKIKPEKIMDVDTSTSLTDTFDSMIDIKLGERIITDSIDLIRSPKSNGSKIRIPGDSESSTTGEKSHLQDPHDKSKFAVKKLTPKSIDKSDSIKEQKQKSKEPHVYLPKKVASEKKIKSSKPEDVESSPSQAKKKLPVDRPKLKKRSDHEKMVIHKLTDKSDKQFPLRKNGHSTVQRTSKHELAKDQVSTIDSKKKFSKSTSENVKTEDKEEFLSRELRGKKVDKGSTISDMDDVKSVTPLDAVQVDKEITREVEGEHARVGERRETLCTMEKVTIIQKSSSKTQEEKTEKKTEETFATVTMQKSSSSSSSLQEQITKIEKSTSKLIIPEVKVMHDQPTSPHKSFAPVETHKITHDKSVSPQRLAVSDETRKMSQDKPISPQKLPKHPKENLSKTQPRYMEWYDHKREEIERKKQVKKEGEDEEQPPKWLRKSTRQRWLKMAPEDRKVFELHTPEVTPQQARRKRIKPLVNVESEQLKAIVRQGRKLRKAEGKSEDDPSIEIFTPKQPPPSPILPSQPHGSSHHRTQHSEYKFERYPGSLPFYLHPIPAAPHPTPQPSPEHFQIPPEDAELCPSGSSQEQSMASPIMVPIHGGSRLRHQQLLEKKSVFDIAYSEAAPSQLRSDSTTPPS